MCCGGESVVEEVWLLSWFMGCDSCTDVGGHVGSRGYCPTRKVFQTLQRVVGGERHWPTLEGLAERPRRNLKLQESQGTGKHCPDMVVTSASRTFPFL